MPRVSLTQQCVATHGAVLLGTARRKHRFPYSCVIAVFTHLRRSTIPAWRKHAKLSQPLFGNNPNLLSRVGVNIRRVLNLMIRFIDNLYTEFITAINYSAIANINTLQFTVAHTLGFSVFTSRT
jgi:hypothetical protein